MGKNGFLERQQAERQACVDAGLQIGRQQIIDMMCIALRDPDIMGKDIFGKDRLLKVVKGIGHYMDVFEQAFQATDETDYWRAKLDAALADAFGEEMHDTFRKRYEYCCDYDYVKGKWKK